MQEEQYSPEQMADAKTMADYLASISEDKHSIFSLMTQAMMIGVEIGTSTRGEPK